MTFLAAGFCLALLMLQSAVVRSDYSHVRIGIYPMIFLGSVIVLSRFGRSLWLELASAAGLVILTALTLRPSSVFLPGAVVEQMQQLRQPLRACPEGYQQMDAACLPADVAQWLAEVAGFEENKPGRMPRSPCFPTRPPLACFRAIRWPAA